MRGRGAACRDWGPGVVEHRQCCIWHPMPMCSNTWKETDQLTSEIESVVFRCIEEGNYWRRGEACRGGGPHGCGEQIMLYKAPNTYKNVCTQVSQRFSCF